MAISEEGNGLVMPVAPMYGGGGNGGFGFGGDWAWIILLLVLCGGWGNGFGGGGFGGGDLYPWMNNSNQINGGFRDAMINDNITSIGDKIVSGFGDISTQLSNGFNGTQMSILQSVNGIQSQLADCCCANQLATVQTQNVIATEAAATRSAIQGSVQTVLDKLCQLELDGYKREVDSLRSQLSDAKFAASQVAQTAEIRASQATTANQLVSELRSCPIPAQPVYGSTPIFSCSGNCGCGG